MLNQIIKDYGSHQTVLGLTSIGRDGEARDLVTRTHKPGIFVKKDTLIATAEGLLKYCDVTKEILANTEFPTPLGNVILLRALSDGNVELAGPSINRQLGQLRYLFGDFGADKVIIDGALSRKSLCSRAVADSVILCCGASFDKSMDKTLAETKFIYEILTAAKSDYDDFIAYIKSKKENRRFILYTSRGDYILPAQNSELWELLKHPEDRKIIAVYVEGALSDLLIKPIVMSGVSLRQMQFILQDSSKMMLSKAMYEKLLRKGAEIRVMDTIPVLAIAINPYSACGEAFPKDDFYKKMKTIFTKVPIVDVMEKTYEQ